MRTYLSLSILLFSSFAVSEDRLQRRPRGRTTDDAAFIGEMATRVVEGRPLSSSELNRLSVLGFRMPAVLSENAYEATLYPSTASIWVAFGGNLSEEQIQEHIIQGRSPDEILREITFSENGYDPANDPMAIRHPEAEDEGDTAGSDDPEKKPKEGGHAPR